MKPSFDSIQATLDEILDEARGRSERSDVRREDTSLLRRQFEDFLQQRQNLMKKRQEGEEKHKRRMKVAYTVGGIIGIAIAGALTAYQQFRPEPVPTAEIKRTVEARTDQLELDVRATNRRLIDGITHLGRKMDAMSPESRSVPEPAWLKESREKLEWERQQESGENRSLEEIFGDPAERSHEKLLAPPP